MPTKCARRSCNETVNVIAKHRENGQTYCIRCARQINAAHEDEICSWDHGPTADELAMVAEIEALPLDTSALLALELDKRHPALPPHPDLGHHLAHCRNGVCPIITAINAKYNAIAAAQREGIFGMSAVQLVEYMLEHGEELFSTEYSPDSEAVDKITQRLKQLKELP